MPNTKPMPSKHQKYRRDFNFIKRERTSYGLIIKIDPYSSSESLAEDSEGIRFHQSPLQETLMGDRGEAKKLLN